MKWRPSNQEENRYLVLVYFVVAFLFSAFGLYFHEPRYYVGAALMLLLGLFRKHVLSKIIKK